ncbi:VOC family protein [Modestobacter sp. Leaf380]|uniref:VOC family protein n=1 Tax=Modestobacter sp. Leaf380 TaxID=1736356 RepID=UPI0006F3F306|nr:VOC family protein [Modestobacter sp. Leaf380]KQS68344.1 glyoxalase [Modestobacter sp. Leaf380]
MDFRLEVVVVPVSDVDASKAFYADRCGFVVDVDRQVTESFRVVQLTPPGSGCSITIGQGLAPMAPGALKGLQLCVTDAVAAHAELAGRGVPVTEVVHFEGGGTVPGAGGDFETFFFFDDPDGNSWAVQQSPVRS